MIPKIDRVLTGAVSAETAFVQQDYPYGRQLRCQRRNWLEFKQKQGFRYVSQTSDPKSSFERWNSPKQGTYTFLAILVLTNEHLGPDGKPSAVSVFGLGPNDGLDDLGAFLAAFGDHLDENQKKQAELLRVLMPRYGRKPSERLYRVLDAETNCLELLDPVHAKHPVFAATVTSREIPSAYKSTELAKYNPPVQYLDEHRLSCIVDSYQLGKQLLIRLEV